MLNPNLDRFKLAEEFALHKRIQIENVFENRFADKIFSCLENAVPWEIVYQKNQEINKLPQDVFDSLPSNEKALLHGTINQQAQTQFQFLYSRYAMLTAYIENRDRNLYTARVIEYIASKNFLDFMRNLTGCKRIASIDAQATCYLPGHFLKLHDDKADQNNDPRLYAYVLNFSKNWQADWGGLLQFVESDEKVIDTFTPKFNSLCIFQVPQYHIVSLVTPFAMEKRLAITGWLKNQ